MNRYHKELNIIRRRARLCRDIFGSYRPAGSFRKTHGLDCGKARCALCHGSKHPTRVPTRQERIADLLLAETAS